MKKLPVRIPSDLAHRIDLLVAARVFPEATRSSVTREALKRGLRALEQQAKPGQPHPYQSE